MLEPRYNIPSQKYFSETVIPSIVERMVCVIRGKLKVIKYLSFTNDVWSSNVSSDSLLSLTDHWVSDDFQLISAVLQAKSLKKWHTGEYKAMKIAKIMEDWGSAPTRYIVW